MAALELRPWPDPQRDRRPVRRDDDLRLIAAVGLLALLAGCGAGSTATNGGGTDGGRNALVIATLGDSITSGSPGYDPDPAARRALGFGTDERSQYEYWAERAYPGLELRNCGVFGERTDEIAARLDTCAEGADGVIIQGGINDIAQGVPVEAAADNLRALVVDAKRLVKDVAITDVLPWNNGYPAADPAIRKLNRLIAEIAREQQVPLLDFHDTLEDPDNPGLMKPQWTADGDHPSVEGYRRLGELAFRAPAGGP